MGQKVNPKALRMGIIYQPRSRWFSDKKEYASLLEQDTKIRTFLRKKLKGARVSNIDIERSRSSVKVIIFTARPGVIIGRGGAGLDDLKKGIQKCIAENRLELNVQEIKRPDLEAWIVSEGIIDQLEKRIPFRKAMKRAVAQVMEAGAQGVRISVAGRLNGAEIARTEVLAQGKIPLQTLRADIDFAKDIARTTYGVIGVKVWIYRGKIFERIK